MYRLREVLPDGIAPAFVRDELTLAGPDEVASSADEVLAAIARADRQDDESRLTILIAALARTERGPYLSRSEEHTSELQSLMRISYAVFCLKKKNTHKS